MLSVEERKGLTVVLVGARNPQNIGAAARAMQDFGFSDLRVVNEFAPPLEAAQMEPTSAVGAASVLRDARRYTSLAEAVAGCSLVVGTTAVGGREPRLEVKTLQDAVAGMREGLATQHGPDETDRLAGSQPRVALLFGSEKTGLTNEQLSFCHALVTIPLFAPEGRHLSMNLGQAVAVCLYELVREGFEGARKLPARTVPMASVEERERLLKLLLEVMHETGYSRRFPANARVEVVRGLVRQLGETREEAFTWMGILRMVLASREPQDLSKEP